MSTDTENSNISEEHQKDLNDLHAAQTQILNMALTAAHNMLNGRTPPMGEIQDIVNRSFLFADKFQKEIEKRWNFGTQELAVKYATNQKLEIKIPKTLKLVKVETKPKEPEGSNKD